MLQIISGKFFSSSDITSDDGKGILYSNCSCATPIRTAIGVLEPITDGDVSSYVFSYKNQIEEHLIISRCGDIEIVEQFKLICSFGLNGFFSEQREQILKVCSPINATGYSTVNQFLKSKVSLNKRINSSDADEFSGLVEKIIGLERKDYKAVMGALKNLSDSVEILQYNIDLAYSMLIYCLESLSQKHNSTGASWNDWDNHKAELDDTLKNVSDEISVNIKNILLKDKHFKLQKNFISFVLNNVRDSFYLSEAEGITVPLRSSQIKQALLNAYQMRSKFVHALQPIQDQIRHTQNGRFDVFTFSNNPYLTFGGLYRLTTHVIRNYIYSLPYVNREDFNYWPEIPGLMTVELVSDAWIADEASFNGKSANHRLGAFLTQLERKSPVTDLTRVMHKITKSFSQTSQQFRAPMLYLFYLYNYLVAEKHRLPGWHEFCKKHEQYFGEFRFENIVIKAETGREIPWPLHDCIDEYKRYSVNRFKDGHLSLSPLTEIIVLSAIANKAHKSGYGSEYCWLINTALREVPGNRKLQSFLYNKMISFMPVPMHELFNWNK